MIKKTLEKLCHNKIKKEGKVLISLEEYQDLNNAKLQAEAHKIEAQKSKIEANFLLQKIRELENNGSDQ